MLSKLGEVLSLQSRNEREIFHFYEKTVTSEVSRLSYSGCTHGGQSRKNVPPFPEQRCPFYPVEDKSNFIFTVFSLKIKSKPSPRIIRIHFLFQSQKLSSENLRIIYPWYSWVSVTINSNEGRRFLHDVNVRFYRG